MKAKDKHRRRMLSYWGDPDNSFITRFAMHTDVLKLSAPVFYRHFNPVELLEIEKEAVELRRLNSSRQCAVVLESLYNEAIDGNVSAAKEFFDRVQGKVIERKEVSGPNGGAIDNKWTVEFVNADDADTK